MAKTIGGVRGTSLPRGAASIAADEVDFQTEFYATMLQDKVNDIDRRYYRADIDEVEAAATRALEKLQPELDELPFRTSRQLMTDIARRELKAMSRYTYKDKLDMGSDLHARMEDRLLDKASTDRYRMELLLTRDAWRYYRQTRRSYAGRE